MGQGAVHVLKPGKILHGRYKLEKTLGEGGFGITYRGTDEVLAAEVAVKEYFPQGLVTRNNIYSEELTVTQTKYDEVFRQGKARFLKEARMLAKFNKEAGVVSVTDFFEENNTAYIVMEYLDGVNLKDYIKQNGLLSVDEMLGLLAPIIEALDAVHKSGLIHRDISPDNIMLLINGGVKLMDFGAARDYTEFGRKSLSIVLKHGFAPEEQYRTHGQQGPWTDIYALCATMYKCITGRTPVESLERVQNDTLRSPAELGVAIPPQVNYAIMKGLAVRRQDRYQNLGEFCNDLYGNGSGINYSNYRGGSAAQGGNGYNGANYGGGNYGNSAGSYGNSVNYGNSVSNYGNSVSGGYGNSGSYGNSAGGYGNSGNYGNSGSYGNGAGGYGNSGNYGNSVGYGNSVNYGNSVGGYSAGNGNGGSSDKSSSGVAAGILIGTVVVLLAGIGFLVWQMSSSGDEAKSDQKAAVETTTEAKTEATEAVTTEATTEATTEEEKASVTLPYTDNATMNVGACLTTADYEIVTSGDGSFQFGYPKYVFNGCEVSAAGDSYRLYYEGGSEKMELHVYTEDNPGNAVSNAKKIYKSYASSMYKILYQRAPKEEVDSQGMSRGILSGEADTSGVQGRYIIAANNGSKNYILDFYFPDNNPEYDYDDINYIMDCVYRYCSFGGTTYKPRTYQQFLAKDMGTKK